MTMRKATTDKSITGAATKAGSGAATDQDKPPVQQPPTVKYRAEELANDLLDYDDVDYTRVRALRFQGHIINAPDGIRLVLSNTGAWAQVNGTDTLLNMSHVIAMDLQPLPGTEDHAEQTAE